MCIFVLEFPCLIFSDLVFLSVKLVLITHEAANFHVHCIMIIVFCESHDWPELFNFEWLCCNANTWCSQVLRKLENLDQHAYSLLTSWGCSLLLQAVNEAIFFFGTYEEEGMGLLLCPLARYWLKFSRLLFATETALVPRPCGLVKCKTHAGWELVKFLQRMYCSAFCVGCHLNLSCPLENTRKSLSYFGNIYQVETTYHCQGVAGLSSPNKVTKSGYTAWGDSWLEGIVFHHQNQYMYKDQATFWGRHFRLRSYWDLQERLYN